MSKIATGLPRSLTVRSNTWLIQILQYGMNFYPINPMLNLFKNKFLPPATKLRHVSVILFKEGGLCPSIHHRSHGQEGLCLRGSLSRGVSVQGGLCPGGSLSRGVSVWWVSVHGETPDRDPPCTVTHGRYAFYWNAFLYSFFFRWGNFQNHNWH